MWEELLAIFVGHGLIVGVAIKQVAGTIEVNLGKDAFNGLLCEVAFILAVNRTIFAKGRLQFAAIKGCFQLGNDIVPALVKGVTGQHHLFQGCVNAIYLVADKGHGAKLFHKVEVEVGAQGMHLGFTPLALVGQHSAVLINVCQINVGILYTAIILCPLRLYKVGRGVQCAQDNVVCYDMIPGQVAFYRGHWPATIGARVVAHVGVIGNVCIDVREPLQRLATVGEHGLERCGVIGHIIEIVVARRKGQCCRSSEQYA